MPIKITAAANVAPVAITTALRSLRALNSEADLVALYLGAAAAAVEDYTGRALINKTFTLMLDGWPSSGEIELRRTPLVEINAVRYYAPSASTLAEYDAVNYRADTWSAPGRLVFATNAAAFPDVEPRQDAVQIEFIAGYGTLESEIPEVLRVAVLHFARQFYDNRVPVADAKMAELPFSLRHILRAMRVESMIPVK